MYPEFLRKLDSYKVVFAAKPNIGKQQYGKLFSSIVSESILS